MISDCRQTRVKFEFVYSLLFYLLKWGIDHFQAFRFPRAGGKPRKRVNCLSKFNLNIKSRSNRNTCCLEQIQEEIHQDGENYEDPNCLGKQENLYEMCSKEKEVRNKTIPYLFSYKLRLLWSALYSCSVKISGPSFVMAIVCSYCAEYPPSAVDAVQPFGFRIAL